MQDSLQTLKKAQVKFQDSKESLDKITPSTQGNPIMVPLTDSMYVEGKVANADKVIIDIGTGFYVEKSIPDAQDYFKRRVAFVTQQMEKLQFIGTEKMKIRDGKKSIIFTTISNNYNLESASISFHLRCIFHLSISV